LKNIAYIGPSWAARSYDTPDGSESDYINLLSEWDVAATDLSQGGTSNFTNIRRIMSQNQKYDGIIWVYSEPIADYDEFTGGSSCGPTTELFESEDFWALREACNQYTLSNIAKLNCPVALIGASSDIINCHYDNITIIHPSWQKFLADATGIILEYGWGADVAHSFLMEKRVDRLQPSKNLVDLISDTLRDWHKLELNGVFTWCHPNRRGTELFATETKPAIMSWIDNL
jgi:hypothetical protein